MKKYLLPENCNYYKANLHVHTNISDGKLTPAEIKEGYKSQGYSVVAYTDHEVFVPHNDLCDENFVALNAVELAVNDNWPGGFKYNKCYHLNLYAKSQSQTECCVCTEKSVHLEHSKAYLTEQTLNNEYEKYHSVTAINDMIKRANDDGFLVCYNHPVWSLHDYGNYSGLRGLWGIEVYNTASARGGYEDTTVSFDDLLRENQRLVAVASDDAHSLNANAYKGWTMIGAEKLDYDSIIDAMENGNCYSSTGPEIKELYIEDGVVHMSFSDAVFVKLMTNIRFSRSKHGTADAPINAVSFDINEFLNHTFFVGVHRNEFYFRLEVMDKDGKRAWTNAYFVDDIQ